MKEHIGNVLDIEIYADDDNKTVYIKTEELTIKLSHKAAVNLILYLTSATYFMLEEGKELQLCHHLVAKDVFKVFFDFIQDLPLNKLTDQRDLFDEIEDLCIKHFQYPT